MVRFGNDVFLLKAGERALRPGIWKLGAWVGAAKQKIRKNF
jgi:hypothetical protein